jgi:hypothetical protein
MKSAIKAWIISEDCEGHGCVVFHAHGIATRRLGAGELNCDFEDVSCRRAPEFDSYAVAGKVPVSDLERNHSLRSGKMPFSPTIPFIVAPV